MNVLRPNIHKKLINDSKILECNDLVWLLLLMEKTMKIIQLATLHGFMDGNQSDRHGAADQQ